MSVRPGLFAPPGLLTATVSKTTFSTLKRTTTKNKKGPNGTKNHCFQLKQKGTGTRQWLSCGELTAKSCKNDSRPRQTGRPRRPKRPSSTLPAHATQLGAFATVAFIDKGQDPSQTQEAAVIFPAFISFYPPSEHSEGKQRRQLDYLGEGNISSSEIHHQQRRRSEDMRDEPPITE